MRIRLKPPQRNDPKELEKCLTLLGPKAFESYRRFKERFTLQKKS